MESNSKLFKILPDLRGYLTGIQVLASQPTDPLVLDVIAPFLPQIRAPFGRSRFSSLVKDYLDCLDRQSVDDPDGRVRAVEKLNEVNKDILPAIEAIIRLKTLSQHRLVHDYPPGTAPIYKLPVELLSYIFSFLGEISPIFHPRKPISVNLSIIMTLNCVCRLWHEVVQEHTPDLWSTISTTYLPKYLEHALAASKGALLNLHIAFGPKTATSSSFFEVGNERERALVQTLAEMPRVRRVDIDFVDNRFAAAWRHPAYEKEQELHAASPGVVFDHLEQVDAPALESFKLSVHNHVRLPEPFGNKELPRLKVVNLDGYRGPAPSFLSRAPNLTSLTLNSCETFWDGMDDLLSFLSGLPSLSTLKISADYGGLPFARNLKPVHHPAQSVTMPSIEWLQLTMELECILPILSSIKLPSNAEIEIAGCFFMIPRVYNGNFLTLVRDLQECFERHLRRSFPSHYSYPPGIDEIQDGFRRVIIRDFGEGWQDEGVTVCADMCSSVDGPPSFEFGACYLPESAKEFLEIVRTMLSLPGIRGAFTRLVIDKRQLLHVSWHWRVIFAYLERVETIDLSGPPARAFLRAYGASSYHCTEETILPHLQKVVLRNGKVGIDVVEEALEYLTWRAERGTVQPISFSIFACSITEDAVRMLREHASVARVVWDGRMDGWEGEKGRRWWDIGFGGESGEAYESDGTASGYGTDPDES